jgi:hypothetical protein
VRQQHGIAHWILPMVVIAIVFPLVVAAFVAIAVFLLTGMFTVWVVWLALAWFFFGHRRMRYASRRRVHWTRF